MSLNIAAEDRSEQVHTQHFILDEGRKGRDRADPDATYKKLTFDFNNHIIKTSL